MRSDVPVGRTCKVGRRPGQRLHVHAPFRGIEPEHFHGPGMAKPVSRPIKRASDEARDEWRRHDDAPLHVVNLLVSTVVAGTGVSLAVLVGQAAAKSLENSSGCVVFGGNESNAIFLTRFFRFDDFEGFWVGDGEVGGGPRGERTQGRARRRQHSADRSSEHSHNRAYEDCNASLKCLNRHFCARVRAKLDEQPRGGGVHNVRQRRDALSVTKMQ